MENIRIFLKCLKTKIIITATILIKLKKVGSELNILLFIYDNMLYITIHFHSKNIY